MARDWRLDLFGLVVLGVAACEPHDRRTGQWLRGDVVTQPVTDWTFSKEITGSE